MDASEITGPEPTKQELDRKEVIKVLDLFCGGFDVVDKPSLYVVISAVSTARGYPLSKRAARKAMESLYASNAVVYGMMTSPVTHQHIARIVKK